MKIIYIVVAFSYFSPVGLQILSHTNDLESCNKKIAAYKELYGDDYKDIQCVPIKVTEIK